MNKILFLNHKHSLCKTVGLYLMHVESDEQDWKKESEKGVECEIWRNRENKKEWKGKKKLIR